MENAPQKTYKIKEVAEILKVDDDYIYRMVKYGNIEAFRINQRNIRITEKALADFVEKMKVRNSEIKHG